MSISRRGAHVVLDCSGSPSRVRPEFGDASNINTIMARYRKTGVLVDPMTVRGGRVARFGDFSNVTDYSSMLNAVMDAQASFARLPAEVRERFSNDPARALEFVADEANVNEAVDLGLLPESMRPVVKGSEPAAPNSASSANSPAV